MWLVDKMLSTTALLVVERTYVYVRADLGRTPCTYNCMCAPTWAALPVHTIVCARRPGPHSLYIQLYEYARIPQGPGTLSQQRLPYATRRRSGGTRRAARRVPPLRRRVA